MEKWVLLPTKTCYWVVCCTCVTTITIILYLDILLSTLQAAYTGHNSSRSLYKANHEQLQCIQCSLLRTNRIYASPVSHTICTTNLLRQHILQIYICHTFSTLSLQNSILLRLGLRDPYTDNNSDTYWYRQTYPIQLQKLDDEHQH